MELSGGQFLQPVQKLVATIILTSLIEKLKCKSIPLGSTMKKACESVLFSTKCACRYEKWCFASWSCCAVKFLRKWVAHFTSHCAKHNTSQRHCRCFTCRSAANFSKKADHADLNPMVRIHQWKTQIHLFRTPLPKIPNAKAFGISTYYLFTLH